MKRREFLLGCLTALPFIGCVSELKIPEAVIEETIEDAVEEPEYIDPPFDEGDRIQVQHKYDNWVDPLGNRVKHGGKFGHIISVPQNIEPPSAEYLVRLESGEYISTAYPHMYFKIVSKHLI